MASKVQESEPNPNRYPNQSGPGAQPHLKDSDPGDPAPQFFGRNPNSQDISGDRGAKGQSRPSRLLSIYNKATQREMPAVAAAYRKYGSKGLEIINVTLDDDYR